MPSHISSGLLVTGGLAAEIGILNERNRQDVEAKALIHDALRKS